MEKENNNNESDSSENEIPDLNSFKLFEFEPKINIGHINTSQELPSEVSSEMFCNKRCSQKFRKIHSKIPVPDSLFK